MKNYIDNVNFHDVEPQRYWTPPASWDEERKKTEVQNAIFSGDYVGARKMDGAFYKFIKDEDGRLMFLHAQVIGKLDTLILTAGECG